MELTDLSPELKELRNVIISSNLTSCYLILHELASLKDETLVYDRFRKHWMGTYKGFYEIVAEMKSRKPRR
jgi:hypothetical protein